MTLMCCEEGLAINNKRARLAPVKFVRSRYLLSRGESLLTEFQYTCTWIHHKRDLVDVHSRQQMS